jgi:hypothetical protein
MVRQQTVGRVDTLRMYDELTVRELTAHGPNRRPR